MILTVLSFNSTSLKSLSPKDKMLSVSCAFVFFDIFYGLYCKIGQCSERLFLSQRDTSLLRKKVGLVFQT